MVKLISIMATFLLIIGCAQEVEMDDYLDENSISDLSFYVRFYEADSTTVDLSLELKKSFDTTIMLNRGDYYMVEYFGKSYKTRENYLTIPRKAIQDTIKITTYIEGLGIVYTGEIYSYPLLHFNASEMGRSFVSTIKWESAKYDNIKVTGKMVCRSNGFYRGETRMVEKDGEKELLKVDFNSFFDSLNTEKASIDTCEYSTFLERRNSGWEAFSSLKKSSLIWSETITTNEIINIK